MTPRIGQDFVQWKPPTGGDETLGVVDFLIFPHLAPDGMPGNSMAEAEQWAASIAGSAYAIDDETAIQVVDGTVDVVSEGHWKLFAPASQNEGDFQPLSVVDYASRDVTEGGIHEQV